MKANEFKYKFYRFLDIIFAIIAVVILLSFVAFNYDSDFKYRKYIQRATPFIFLSLSVLSLLIIWIKQYLHLNTWRLKKLFDILLFKSYKFKAFSISVSIFYTTLIAFLSFYISFLFIDESKLNDFISNSNVIILITALYISIYSIIFAIIISKSQIQEIYGFESFLNNLADDLYILNEKAHLPNNDKVYEVVIVDFHPFIGSKSLGIKNTPFKRYIKAIEKTALNDCIKLTIICHSKEMIESSFNAEEKIHSGNLINSLAVNNAIDELAIKGQKVNIWRSDLIGPYHFIIIDDIAYDYLVVPFHYLSNKNTIQGNKHIDQSKVVHIHKAFHDIISATIKPKELDLSSSKVKGDIYDTTKQKNIKGIKLRFQFEEKEDKNRNPIINGKKGNFPIYDLKDTDCTFYILDDHFKIEKVKSSCNKFEEVYITHNITDQIAKYGDLSSTTFNVDSIKNGTDFETQYRGMKFTFSYSNNIFLLKEMIFKFDIDINGNVFLEHRTFSRSITDKVFYKIKIIKDNELIESEYSYKAKVTLW